MESPAILTREALNLITDELEQIGLRVDTMAPKVETMSESLGRIERLLVQNLQAMARAEDQAARKKVALEERLERVERAQRLRPANGV